MPGIACLILCPDPAFGTDARLIYPSDEAPILLWGEAEKAVLPEFGKPSRIELYALQTGSMALWLIKRSRSERDATDRLVQVRRLYKSQRGTWFTFRWDNFVPLVSLVRDESLERLRLPTAGEMAWPEGSLVDLLNIAFVDRIAIDANDSLIALYV